MYSLNRSQILGNLTKDPEMRYTPNGQAVANFGVATNRKWKNQDGTDGESVEFHDVVVWGKMAENVVPMLKKGQPAFVEGRLQTRNWEGQDGVKRYKTEIIAENIIVLGGKSGNYTPPTGNDSAAKSEPKKTEATPAAEEEINIDDIPF